MSEGCAADKFLKFTSAPSTARCPERSAGTQTAGRLFLAYLILAKQKKSESPAAATERHRDSSKNQLIKKEHGFDRLSPNGAAVKGFDTSARTDGRLSPNG